ncbi:NHL repeat-containing protein [uncultured Croceitalea sp.]|uniref:NHL repeat-containing protein n=1 Tax=uncultured Croceitalea sp. TaxID=1798908 RepID=UPI003305C4E5
MKYLYIIVVVTILFSSCIQKEEVPKEWKLSNIVQLEGVNPIGIAEVDESLWLSDGDHNRLVQIDDEGKILKTIDSLDRPMHIATDGSSLFIPQYGRDNVAVYKNGVMEELVLNDSLDAPAGVGVFKGEKAIADFYNNRILFNNGKNWISFGKEGKNQGEFYYPTDVQITDSLIWVADAYNNRIQVFDKQGNFVKMMGQDQKMNAATGIYVSDKEVFITDFENDRVLIFDKNGNLKQTLKDEIEKPTDMIIMNNTLYIINYRNGKLSSYTLNAVDHKES